MNHSTPPHRIIQLLLVASIALFACSRASSQGSGMPSVSNVTATSDATAHTVTLDFTLADPENDPLEVGLQIVGSDGSSYAVPTAQISGEIGYPVMPGARRIIWTFDPADPRLSSGVGYRAMVVADDRYQVDIAELVAMVDSARLRSNLELIAGIRHPQTGLAKLELTKTMIENYFGAYGLRIRRQEWTAGTYTAANIIGTIPGSLSPDSIAILCAHFDSVRDAPGADDNGSGVVGMWEVIRALSQQKFRRSVRFIGFDQEEAGLVGSSRYVTSGILPNEKITGVIDYEMIGFYSSDSGSQKFPAGFNQIFKAAYDSVVAHKNRGDFITNVANQTSNPLRLLFDSSAERYVPELRVISIAEPASIQVPDLRRSDHAPFWNRGYSALMITDGANFRNPNYHTPGDSIGTLNFGFMGNVVKATVATLARLGGIMHAGADSSNTFTIQSTNAVRQSASAAGVMLLQNVPNPSGSTTTIPFVLPARRHVTLEIFDNTGRLVSRPVDGMLDGGRHDIMVVTDELPSGAYTYRLTAGSDVVSRMMWRVR